MNARLTLADIFSAFGALGCTSVLCKPLAENDNSKNQVYLGPDFAALNVLPHGELTQEGNSASANFKASLDWSWINDELKLSRAAGAQLILYPQYPEVRLSGFLRGSETAPSALMRPRAHDYEVPQRILLLGINSSTGSIIGFLSVSRTKIFEEISNALKGRVLRGVFYDLTLLLPAHRDPRAALLETLKEIALRGWIRSKRLDKDRNILPCESPNCGGYTLEAELGITPNSRSEPDYLGWEVKQHRVESLEDLPRRLKLKGSPITLMTPEPKAGLYIELGVESFIRKFGYPDRVGRLDRLNFGGKYVCETVYPLTGLMLTLEGFDVVTGKMKADGRIKLVRPGESDAAAIWPFADLLKHWSRKHAKAAYVPSLSDKMPQLVYRFGSFVRLGEGTDFIRFLKALAEGTVYYDPGIKLENAGGQPRIKRRSQFRIISGDLPRLYDSMSVESLL